MNIMAWLLNLHYWLPSFGSFCRYFTHVGFSSSYPIMDYANLCKLHFLTTKRPLFFNFWYYLHDPTSDYFSTTRDVSGPDSIMNQPLQTMNQQLWMRTIWFYWNNKTNFLFLAWDRFLFYYHILVIMHIIKIVIKPIIVVHIKVV